LFLLLLARQVGTATAANATVPGAALVDVGNVEPAALLGPDLFLAVPVLQFAAGFAPAVDFEVVLLERWGYQRDKQGMSLLALATRCSNSCEECDHSPLIQWHLPCENLPYIYNIPVDNLRPFHPNEAPAYDLHIPEVQRCCRKHPEIHG